MNITHRDIGLNAEEVALNFLKSHGLTLLKRNFYSRFGEIDLIMQDYDDVVFVEVKLRAFGINNAIESITPSKQRKLVKTAQFYLLQNDGEINCRFDAVVIDKGQNIEWLKNIIML